MPSEGLRKAMNEQIGHEVYSAYLYLAMSAYCAHRNLTGFAHWMRLQAREEVGHAMKFVDFLIDRGERVALPPVDRPPADFGSPLQVMERSLEHERKVTAFIGELYRMAVEERDYAAQVFLQWFVTEQVEEEATIDLIIQRLKMFGAEGVALMTVDQELGGRSPEPAGA